MSSISKIGLGLAALGRPAYINIRGNTTFDTSVASFKKNAFEVLDYAYLNGVRYFDTAPSYGKGEAFLAEWNSQKRRSNLNLSTKWGYTYVANWNLEFKGKHEIKEHSIEKLLEQWEFSKKLLPELKIYQIHSATFDSGVFENNAVLNQLHHIKKETGLKIGLSTSGSNQAEILETALKINVDNEPLFDSFQVTYNILEQSTHVVLKEILDQNKTVIIKEGLANGRLFKNNAYNHYNELYLVLEELSKKYKVGVDAIALRFVMDFLNPQIVLSGASTKKQLKQNLSAYNFKLEKEELTKLSSFKINSDSYWQERSKMDWN